MLAFARWFLGVTGGLLLGAGLTLHGQVAFARHLQNEASSTFFLWRAIGNATFALQGADVRMALAMNEVPPEAIEESDRAAWVLVIVGTLIALTGPLLRAGSARGTAKPRARRA